MVELWRYLGYNIRKNADKEDIVVMVHDKHIICRENQQQGLRRTEGLKMRILFVACESYRGELDAALNRLGTERIEPAQLSTALHGDVDWVLDARPQTEAARMACREAGAKYLALQPPIPPSNMVEAAEVLEKIQSGILWLASADGFRSLCAVVPKIAQSVFALTEALAETTDMVAAGLSPQRVAYLPGAMTPELLDALMQAQGCGMVLAEAGQGEAISRCARALGFPVMMVGGRAAWDADHACRILAEAFPAQVNYFPLFVLSEDRLFVVVGGGNVAWRRIKTLMRFRWRICVVAPDVKPEIAVLAREGALEWLARDFEAEDLLGAQVATAATDDREVNRYVGELCRAQGIPVSVADCRLACDYFFPAVALQGRVVAGITGDGTDHHVVARAAAAVRRTLRQLCVQEEERSL